MMNRKQTYLLLGLAGILIAIVVVLGIVAATRREATQEVTPTPTPAPQAETNPPVRYDKNAFQESIDKLEHKQPLSDQDITAKNKIISSLPQGDTSGIVFTSATIRIIYIYAFDSFDVEILTTDINRAKNDANAWFRSQGVSQEGICNIPVGFYLNYDVAIQLRGKGVVFNPLPNSC